MLRQGSAFLLRQVSKHLVHTFDGLRVVGGHQASRNDFPTKKSATSGAKLILIGRKLPFGDPLCHFPVAGR